MCDCVTPTTALCWASAAAATAAVWAAWSGVSESSSRVPGRCGAARTAFVAAAVQTLAFTAGHFGSSAWIGLQSIATLVTTFAFLSTISRAAPSPHGRDRVLSLAIALVTQIGFTVTLYLAAHRLPSAAPSAEWGPWLALAVFVLGISNAQVSSWLTSATKSITRTPIAGPLSAVWILVNIDTAFVFALSPNAAAYLSADGSAIATTALQLIPVIALSGAAAVYRE